MSVYKDNATGKWRVIYRYTDITGKRKQTQKRGFETKREAVAWEHEMMLKAQAKLDMTFGSFYEIYEADKASRLKQSTWETKSHIIRTKILPYFADRKIVEIEVRDVIAWQNELLAAFKDEGKEERYSQDYLRTIQAQLTMFGVERKEFREYLWHKEQLSFTFEGVHYCFYLDKVKIYAQCYAAIANRMGDMNRLRCVDLGSWTMDVLSVKDKVPKDFTDPGVQGIFYLALTFFFL